jgi:hypothetical protein
VQAELLTHGSGPYWFSIGGRPSARPASRG